MKRSIWAALLCAASAACLNGQVTPVGPVIGLANQAGILYASNFGQWQVPMKIKGEA